MAEKKKERAKVPEGQNPFLHVEDIKAGDVFALSGWIRKRTGQFGPQIILEGTLNRTGQMYDLSITEGSQNHRKLFKGMGRDEKTWAGSMTLGIGKLRNGNPFLEIRSVESENPPF